MAWDALDRRSTAGEPESAEALSEAVREKIRAFFPRYETRRAVVLPALHVVQDALGHVSHQAMKEIAALLELPASAILDTISFYTHFWTHEKGRKVIVLCRSLSCQLMGADAVKQALCQQLGIGEHDTTADGRYSFVTEECLAACDHAPCLLVNERLHRRVSPDGVAKLLADESNATHDVPRSALFDGPPPAAPAAESATAPAAAS